jgi:hypothetical protein
LTVLFRAEAGYVEKHDDCYLDIKRRSGKRKREREKGGI